MEQLKLLFSEAFKEWFRDRAPGMAASIAFFAFLGYAPLIAFIILLGIRFIGEEKAQEAFIPMVVDFVHPEFISTLTELLQDDFQLSPEGLVSVSIIGGVALLLGTTEYFGQIKSTIESMWNMRRDKFSLGELVNRKVKTFIIALASVLILLSGFLLTYLFPGISGFRSESDLIDVLLWPARHFFPFLSFFLLALFFLIYIPPVKFDWKLALPGALLAAVLHLLGRLVLRNYLTASGESESVQLEYMLILLFWFYYSSQVFIFSAEFSKVYISRKLNIKIENLSFN